MSIGWNAEDRQIAFEAFRLCRRYFQLRNKIKVERGIKHKQR